MIRWPEDLMARSLDDQMTRRPDDQMVRWPDDQMARRPDCQKSESLNEKTLFMSLVGDLPPKTQNVMLLVVKLSLPLTQRNGKDRAQIFS